MNQDTENSNNTKRFLQSVGKSTFLELVVEAKMRDTTVQNLIRSEIIPQWLNSRGRALYTNQEAKE